MTFELDTSGDFCTCRGGRDYDGTPFGPCAFCERISDEEAELQSLTWDALRWRLTQRPGFAWRPSEEFDDTESNIGVVYVGGRRVGVGRTMKDAVDCALYLLGEHGDDMPWVETLRFWQTHYRSRYAGPTLRYVKPPVPEFYLTDDGKVNLKEAGQ
jgi:hypothetical protein